MSANAQIEFKSPVGRLVGGSLYQGSTTDMEGNKTVFKSGKNAGQEKTNYWFYFAIPKGPEKHWKETAWGKKVWDFAKYSTPSLFLDKQGNEITPHSFSWKVIDGDSTLPNTKGNKPCDREGYAGHWVINFTNAFLTSFVDRKNKRLDERMVVNCGDYIQVFASLSTNGSTNKPGLRFQQRVICFAGYGERIVFNNVDPESIDFASEPLPPGVSDAPQGVVDDEEDDKYLGILNPPPPPAEPVKPVTDLAREKGFTYEGLVAAGWSEQQMIQHGYMAA